jgi:tRNA dimethylallyltransferase
VKQLLAVAGPTASGKSAAALFLALRFAGEIINADPQQFYQGMDIGTAKPGPKERARVPHHLLDITPPAERPALRLFQRAAGEILDSLWAKQALPVLVGGSGQYVWGLIEGWTVPEVPPDEALRNRLEARAESEGAAVLHQELAQVDPEAAAKIDVNNVRRVVRALEVYERTGRPISSCQQRHPLLADVCVLGMDISREELDRRIEQRTVDMFAAGLVNEARTLLAAGYDSKLPSLQSIGYRDAVAVAAGDITESEAIERTTRDTKRLARRQMAWFKRDDPRIHWVRWDDHDAMAAVVQATLGIPSTLAHPSSNADA